MPNLTLEFLSGLVGFLLTLMVLSYLIGDSPLFRFATYLFVGVTAGYIAVVVWSQVIVANLFTPLLTKPLTENVLLVVPLLLFVLMLMNISPRLSTLGGPAVGYVAGVGAAVAVGGAILGTLLPQTLAAADPFEVAQGGDPFSIIETMFNGLVLLLGTITTLAYFQFGARRKMDGTVNRNFLVNLLAGIGQFFIAITFGVLFAGVYSAALTALIERIGSLIGLLFGSI